MKKLLITENQLKMIKKRLQEGVSDTYERRVSVDLNYYGVKINGNEIDDASCNDFELSYNIEIEGRSWGIKDISLYGITGPSELEIMFTVYNEEKDDYDETYLTLPCDWENAEHEEETGNGVVTVGSEITINLKNNENGEIFIESIHVPVYTL
jgi:hypothetical protein